MGTFYKINSDVNNYGTTQDLATNRPAAETGSFFSHDNIYGSF